MAAHNIPTDLEKRCPNSHQDHLSNPICHCGMEDGDVEHFLLHCMDFAQQRESMISRIEIAYHHHNVPPGQRTLDVKTLGLLQYKWPYMHHLRSSMDVEFR